MEPVTVGLIASGAASLIGGLLGKGKKPQIAPFTPVNLDEEQRRAIAGNERNFEASSDLATRTNTYNQAELRRMLRVAIPNYDALVGKQGDVISSMLSGELPKDVVNQIQRNSAERAGAGGYGVSGMGRNLEARDLGLNSLQLVQQGLSSAERWLAGTKALSVPGQMDVASMFLSPAQRAAATVANNTGQQMQQQFANNVAAAPDPTMNAIGGLFSQVGGSLFGAGMTSAFSGPTQTSTNPNFTMMGTGNSSIFSSVQNNLLDYNSNPSSFGVSGRYRLP